ncbi:Ribosome association toxin RatA [Cytospora mali]|uniref:Ribosome association toxin RatA n=1 Tax=Cytospora mali TaxID=578113 RepID=A0A194W3W4_CYTMA|nr:Ribosome association toxin RatA [Valsa mali]
MATRAPLRLSSPGFLRRSPVLIPRRSFFQDILPSNKPLTINVTRTLPYPRSKLYDLIVDVDSYSGFLPYCQHSLVTAWASPDSNSQPPGRRWPIEGELTIGFGPITQSYTSRIVCVPGRSVEALSGKEETSIQAKDGDRNPFKRLVTKWTVEDDASKRDGDWTKVDLDLSMLFADPLVQMMLGKVADETATKMIEAFEQRARQLFGSGR